MPGTPNRLGREWCWRSINVYLLDLFLFPFYPPFPCLRNKPYVTGSALHSRTWELLVAHSCPTLCNPMDCSPPGSSVLGILQARILAWVAIPWGRNQVSCIAGGVFTVWATSRTCFTLILSPGHDEPLCPHLRPVNWPSFWLLAFIKAHLCFSSLCLCLISPC